MKKSVRHLCIEYSPPKLLTMTLTVVNSSSIFWIMFWCIRRLILHCSVIYYSIQTFGFILNDFASVSSCRSTASYHSANSSSIAISMVLGSFRKQFTGNYFLILSDIGLLMSEKTADILLTFFYSPISGVGCTFWSMFQSASAMIDESVSVEFHSV